MSLAVFLIVLFLPRIPQEPAYHQFADHRCFWGIENFFDVISNILFAGIGGFGLLSTIRVLFFDPLRSPDEKRVYVCYLGFFLGVLLTGFGSGYYHLDPTNDRLFWDRLPMTIAFMSFLSAVIGERISMKAGFVSCLPLLFFGIASVLYWDITEQAGNGDLRLYILVQYYPMVLIPLLLLLFPGPFPRGTDIVWIFAFYAAAKGCEVLDAGIYDFGHIVSGHTLKHLFAAGAVYWIFRMIRGRDQVICRRLKKRKVVIQ